LDRNLDGAVSTAEFLDKIRGANTILHPAFSLQHFLQVFTLGTKAWERIASERTKRFGDRSLFDIFDLDRRGVKRMKSGPLDLVRDMSRSRLREDEVPEILNAKLDVAHELVRMTRERTAAHQRLVDKAKARAGTQKGKETLKGMQCSALKLVNSGTQIAFARDKRVTLKSLVKSTQVSNDDADDSIAEDSVQFEMVLPKMHQQPEKLEPISQNFVNRSSPAVAIWQMATGTAPGLNQNFVPRVNTVGRVGRSRQSPSSISSATRR